MHPLKSLHCSAARSIIPNNGAPISCEETVPNAGKSHSAMRFLAWVTQGLAPTLQKGNLVILDNLATHKIRGILYVACGPATPRVGFRPLY
jgi:hypothetical protein